MERHPAGCDPSSFRSLPTPSRVQSTVPSNNPRSTVPTTTDLQQYQGLLDVPGILSALNTLENVASDVVQPVTRYNRYTYLNRFNTAALQLADSFIEHINQIRRRELQEYTSTFSRHSRSTPRVGYSNREADSSSDESDLIIRKRSARLTRKRPRPIFSSSDEDEEYVPQSHRKSLPRRSKEICTNLNDDLAYTLMARRSKSPDKQHQYKRLKPASPVETLQSSSSSSSEDEDEAALCRVVRPLPFVRRRPLTSDNSSLTPFVEQDDDSTDTENQRREHARLSLKTVIYGPGKAEFTEKEILAVFPARSKRRMRGDRLVATGRRPPVGYGTLPSSQPWKPTMSQLCPIPKDMYARYLTDSYWISPTPQDVADTGVFRLANGLPKAPSENAFMSKQRLPSSDRETRDGDSGKLSPATYVQSGSSTTGSPRAKKSEMQNGHIDIELGPALSSLKHAHREELKGGKDTEVGCRKNGKINQPALSQFQAWKDLAPYGRVSRLTQNSPQALEQKKVDTSNTPGSTVGLQSTSNQNVGLVAQKKKVTLGYTGLSQDNMLEAKTKLNQWPNTHPQSCKPAQASAGRSSQPMVKTKLHKNGSGLQKPLTAPPQPSQALVKSVQPVSSSYPSNQMTVVARGPPAMSALGMHHVQMGIQPQLSLQAQATLMPAVPMQLAAHPAVFPAQHILQLQQYGQNPRMLSQWQLQNAAVQQAPGPLQLPPGYVGANSMVPHAPTVPAQGTFTSMQPLPTATNALVTAGTTMMPDAVCIQANGVVTPTAAEAAQPNISSPTSPSSQRQGNFNSQFQEQYRKHYKESYSRSYLEKMKSLRKELGRDGTP